MPKMPPKSVCKYNHKSIRGRIWKTKHNLASLCFKSRGWSTIKTNTSQSNNVLAQKLKRIEEEEEETMTRIVVVANKKIQPSSFPETLLLSLVQRPSFTSHLLVLHAMREHLSERNWIGENVPPFPRVDMLHEEMHALLLELI